MCELKKLSELINDKTSEKSNEWITAPENKSISSIKRPDRLKQDAKKEHIKNFNVNSSDEELLELLTLVIGLIGVLFIIYLIGSF